MPPHIIVVCSPTASGKTRLGVELARRFHGEVVSADSMQVYRKMDIGTAKPTREERGGVPHHMLDVADPREEYSVARYAREATACVDDILDRGKLPILVGGTGQYIDAVKAGHSFAAFRPDSGVRQALQARAEAEGGQTLWRELEQIDPAAAARIHPNDLKRLIRALEVWRETGKTITQHNLETKTIPPRYLARTIGLKYENRDDLRRSIDRRVDEMMAGGLFEEVKDLLQAGIPLHCTAMQAIGYKELAAAVLGRVPMDEAVAEVKLRSRQYAKRQLTWFRRDPQIHWINWERNPDFSRALQDSTEFIGNFAVP